MLKFIYGTMAAGKSLQALILLHQYGERNVYATLIKPGTDARDGKAIVRSRIGISAEALVFGENDSILEYANSKKNDARVFIADEAQFFTPSQVDELRRLADDEYEIICYGLKTNFKTELFAGSKRLIEVADIIEEIPSMCVCGRKATVSARIDFYGRIVRDGPEILLGGNDTYEAMCHHCWESRTRGWHYTEKKNIFEED